MAIQSYQDLRVWQQAMSLAEGVYRITKEFPRDEVFGLTAQLRRAASSIPANIAEGYGREMTGSYVHFLRIAQGSLKELETHALLASRVDMLSQDGLVYILDASTATGKMLRSLIRSLEKA
jgi:four helix bundle protein